MLLLCVIPPTAMAQQEPLNIPDALFVHTASNTHKVQSFLLWTDTIYDVIPGGDSTHKVVLWCTDDILLYSMDLFVGGTTEYVIKKDSIRQNGQILEHDGHSGEGDIRLEIIQDSTINLGSFPIVLSQPGSLMIPIRISSDFGVQAVATITYVGGRNTHCHLDSFNPGVIGAPFPTNSTLSGFGTAILEATKTGVDDFNDYLRDIHEDWQMALTIRDTRQQSISEIIDDIDTSIYLGPLDGPTLYYISQHSDDIVVVSCCATADSLSLEDNIFRTAPTDAYLGASLARLMSYNDIQVILPVWTDTMQKNEYLNHIIEAFEKEGGTVDEGIMQQEGLTLGELAPQIEERIKLLTDNYGADTVAVVTLPTHFVDFMQTMSEYPQTNTIRWFGTDLLARNSDIIQNNASRTLASNSGFTTLQMEGVGIHLDDIRQRLTSSTGMITTHDMLAAYESAWILGLAMQYTQSTDAQRLSEAIPYIAARYSGTLGVMRMDSNGDVLGGSLEVWSVHNGNWTLAGTMKRE